MLIAIYSMTSIKYGCTVTFMNLDFLGYDSSLANNTFPQLGFYCNSYDKKPNKVQSSSISVRNRKQYVPLRCNDDGTLSRFGESNGRAIDVYKVFCKKKQYPTLMKKKNDVGKQILCSTIGADGRKVDLSHNIHYVQLGWDMSAMNRKNRIHQNENKSNESNKIKNMVSLRTSSSQSLF